MASNFSQGLFRQFNQLGTGPLSGGKVYFYEAGTSTPKDTYTTQDESTAHTNPVILDPYGS